MDNDCMNSKWEKWEITISNGQFLSSNEVETNKKCVDFKKCKP